MYKRDLQHSIIQREKRDTRQTDAWLRSEGVSPDSLATIDSELVKAQRIAYTCLKHHHQLLTKQEAEMLTRFLQSMETRRTRRRIKASRTHKVMNIGNRINRQLFKQLKQLRQTKQHQKNEAKRQARRQLEA